MRKEASLEDSSVTLDIEEAKKLDISTNPGKLLNQYIYVYDQKRLILNFSIAYKPKASSIADTKRGRSRRNTAETKTRLHYEPWRRCAGSENN